MKKLLAILLCTLMLLICTASAMADGDSTYLDTPPAEVIQHLAAKYPGYTLEDYIAIRGTTNGDYGFAMISSGSSRALVGFHAENGLMKSWRRNTDALPQGEGRAFFQRHQANENIHLAAGDGVYGNDLGFSMHYYAPGYGEFPSHLVSYHWHDGGFKLNAYSDWTAFEKGSVYVTDDGLTFYDWGHDKVIKRVKGTVQRDIRYVSFSALPKTLSAAEKKLTVAPAIPAGELTAQSIKFTGGQKYEVYSAPDGIWALRGNDNKAVVSTNDWIQVFGEENGWILIQYAIDSEHMRFGYIPVESLPKSANVAPLNWKPQDAWLTRETIITDDPLYSRSSLITLPEGAWVTALAKMGDWVYVESSTGDYLRGFVKRTDLRYDMVFDLAGYSDGLAAGTLTVTPEGFMTLSMSLRQESLPASFTLMDEAQHILIGTARIDAQNIYRLEGPLPAGTTSISLIPADGNGLNGTALFQVEW